MHQLSAAKSYFSQMPTAPRMPVHPAATRRHLLLLPRLTPSTQFDTLGTHSSQNRMIEEISLQSSKEEVKE